MIYVQGTLQKAFGWNFKPNVLDSAAAFSAGAATQFDICTWLFSVDFDDPDATYGQFTTSKAPYNWSKVYDTEADALFDKQSQTLDTAQRKQLAQQLELKYLNGFPSLSLLFRNRDDALWNTVHDYKIGSYLYVNQRFQDVWLSKA